MKYKILIIDDEKIVRNSLKRMLSSEEWDISTAGSINDARESIDAVQYDLVIVDYKLDDGNGMEIIDYVNETHPEIPTIMLTAYGNISLAVDAVKKGASDFLEKESDPELLRHTIDQALEKVRLRKEVEALQHEKFGGEPLESLVAVSDEMQEVLDIARECARCDATILIDGETGTGKSVLAEHIHQASDRREEPFVTINCGSIPTELIESELFGYEKGAFTGASKAGKTGLIEKAHGGTLFLDEIGNLPLGMQAKLLFVLEKGEFLRVGAVDSTRVDVRFIAATNADLEEKIDAGDFRSDLYYRLNIAHITIPPLREHTCDILPLAKQFLHELNQKFGKSVTHISDGAKDRLLAYA
ncbi:MAG: response regulator, partial [Candidatus Marinimicrobia bacterium]|nr:response regulator [Candidatus Neomarinimicrobiota bacterium]